MLRASAWCDTEVGNAPCAGEFCVAKFTSGSVIHPKLDLPRLSLIERINQEAGGLVVIKNSISVAKLISESEDGMK